MGRVVQKLKPRSLKDISSEDISSIDTNDTTVSYTHLTLPTKRIV